jgi:hypothetical protein
MARYDKDEHRHIVQTDARGLETLSSHAPGATTAVCSALAGIGELLVYADAVEIKKSLNDLGWLLAALGELWMDLENTQGLIDSNLKRVAVEAKAKTGKVAKWVPASVSFSDREWAVVQEYAAEHGLSEAEAAQRILVAGMAEWLARAGESRPGLRQVGAPLDV